MIEKLVDPQPLDNDVAVMKILQLMGQLSPNDIQWSNPNNGIIRATKTGAFTSSNILISVENINGGGVPYICTGQKSTSNFISINIFLHDGTLLSTPNFTNLPVEIRIYN